MKKVIVKGYLYSVKRYTGEIIYQCWPVESLNKDDRHMTFIMPLNFEVMAPEPDDLTAIQQFANEVNAQPLAAAAGEMIYER